MSGKAGTMTARHRRLSAIAPLLITLAACSGLAGGSTVTSAARAVFPPKPDDCEIMVYVSGKPGGTYDVVARLTARIDGPQPPNGDIALALPELKSQACQAGADAIINLGFRRDPQRPIAIVSAQAIRFAAPR